MKEIRLTQGKIALVDDEDFEWLNQWKWYVDKGYATRNIRLESGKRITIKMHRMILGLNVGDEMFGDHINGNRSDNRRENLRSCSHAENQRNAKKNSNNSSGFKGVSFDKQHKKWVAQISINGKGSRIGFFSTPEAAHSAYCAAALKHHGEFANFGY